MTACQQVFCCLDMLELDQQLPGDVAVLDPADRHPAAPVDGRADVSVRQLGGLPAVDTEHQTGAARGGLAGQQLGARDPPRQTPYLGLLLPAIAKLIFHSIIQNVSVDWYWQ